MCRDDPVSASAGSQEAPHAENDAARQDGAPGIGEAKERTDDPIRGGSFAGGGGWFGAGWRTLDGALRGAAQR